MHPQSANHHPNGCPRELIADKKITRYASLGHDLRDKAVFGLFWFISWSANHRGIRNLTRHCPKIWLRPSRLNGFQIVLDPADVSQTVIFDEIFLQGSYDLEKVGFDPDVIIDCGAHVGMFLLMAAVRFPNAKLLAYEPNPKNAALVRAQLLRNGLKAELHEAAVSTASSKAIFLAINSHGGRISGANQGSVPQGTFEEFSIDTLNLKDEIERIAPDSLLLKMDIEGEERDVLPAIMSTLPRKTALFFETHFGDAGWLESEKLLHAHGFEVEQLNSRGLYCDGFAFRD
jgi:FkbM family methyltransferase